MKTRKRPIQSILVMLCMVISLMVPVFAASEEPEITLQPQSPNYPEYSVASYTVKVSGSNLSATWYMEWLGDTYTISDLGGAIQPWEAYAGEGYGPRQLDDNTFAFIFEGIEYDLDGAYIWCVLEDGHYDVTSQKARISVGNEFDPPEILEIPAQLTVTQGAEAEIRCIARSPGDTQLSFLWYETDTGKLEDIRAVDRGAETGDCLLCDTSATGTRNYVCQVETSDGGMTWSSIVPVTVTKQTAAAAPQTAPPETLPQQTAPPETQATEETTAPGAVVEPEPPAQTKESPEKVTQATASPELPEPVQAQQETVQKNTGIPWWALALTGLVGVGTGAAIVFIVIRKK